MLSTIVVMVRAKWMDSMAATLTETRKGVFAGNLAALAVRSPGVAKLVQAAQPHAGAAFRDADDGATALTLNGIAMCSQRQPMEEARRFAGRIDLEHAGGVVVLGFGAGHHVRAIVERARGASLVIVFEPDVALLRAVLEHIDCAGWLGTGQVAIVTDADDPGQLAASMQGGEGFLSIGIEIIEHPPSKQRLADTGGRFSSRFADAVSSMRTSVVTTLMQSDVTLRNQLMNIDHYVTRRGVNDLAGVARGAPGLVISAGPSLQRNLHLLDDPAVRDRAVLIAVQTMLKPLLERGVRPHFVMALDHHEISKRFYEGLTAQDVEGVTLVIEAKANPAIADSFPGQIRVVGDERLDGLLGADVVGSPAKARIKPGATVAHLAYYFAKHLGCSPVILMGQDLGFTDGQYYADGASIHQVWACELNTFRTLEMFEWERIVRNRRHLRRLEDHLGRAIYSDAQMENYLAHFEADFARDIEAGLRIIDATEGGVRKRGPEIMPLAEALGTFATKALPDAFRAQCHAASGTDRAAVEPARARLQQLWREVREIARLSRETARLLRKIPSGNQARANDIINRVHQLRDQVEGLAGGYALVRQLNQTGALKRFKADRPLMLAGDDLPALERQQRQVERDAMNVSWIAEVADLASDLLGDAEGALRGLPKRTRDPALGEDGAKAVDPTVAARKVKCPAVICLTARDTEPMRIGETTALALTVQRLRRAKLVHRVVVLAPDEAIAHAARAQLNHDDPRVEVRVQALSDAQRTADERWLRCIGRARRWARLCWRSGIAGASCFDEAVSPQLLHGFVEDAGAAAVLVCDARWSGVEPALCDALLTRFAEDPERHPLTFTQAAPGLAPCVLGTGLVRKLAEAAREQVTYGTIGGLLSYMPMAPLPDPIARSTCWHVDPALRDANERFVIDDEAAAQRMSRLWDRAGASMDALRLVEALHDGAEGDALDELHIALVGFTRPRQGLQAAWHALMHDGAPMDVAYFERAVREAVAERPDVAVTLTGPGGRAIAGDPVDHPLFADLVARARDVGVQWLHVRTSGRSSQFDEMLEPLAQCDVVSVDLLARTAPVARAILGEGDSLARANERAIELHKAMVARDGGIERWVVPRITRCDAAYCDIEPFYDQWINTLGAAVIDPLPRAIDGERIAPLTVPRLAAVRRARRVRHVRADGSVVGASGAGR
ncbi:MAG: DUF115 domain-containing protein [Phycisphaerales bacterium]|nr:DUF115 domain-containing protein [Phycisphaerales bacterium]